jgi:hypothetical protein
MPDDKKLTELLDDLADHQVDALNAAVAGAPKAAAISIANAEVVLEQIKGETDETGE